MTSLGILYGRHYDFFTAFSDNLSRLSGRVVTSPDGNHLFPAFPYTSYRLMKFGDVRYLFAYSGAAEQEPAFVLLHACSCRIRASNSPGVG